MSEQKIGADKGTVTLRAFVDPGLGVFQRIVLETVEPSGKQEGPLCRFFVHTVQLVPRQMVRTGEVLCTTRMIAGVFPMTSPAFLCGGLCILGDVFMGLGRTRGRRWGQSVAIVLGATARVGVHFEGGGGEG